MVGTVVAALTKDQDHVDPVVVDIGRPTPAGVGSRAVPAGWRRRRGVHPRASGEQLPAPSAPVALEILVREHVAGHDLANVLASLTAARDATAAVGASADRAWDIVRLRRQQAAERGEQPYSDPVAQTLSAALVGTEEYQAVRDRLGETGRS